MSEDIPPEIQSAAHRSKEVFEAIAARKGERYALQVSMFVSCSKMQVMTMGPNIPAQFVFNRNLLECFGIEPKDFSEFIDNCDALTRAQAIL